MNKVVLFVLAILLFQSFACPGLFSGIGGGCGGGCGHGCRRHKRSIDKQEEFFGISSNSSDMLCNSPELRSLMINAMREDAVNSSKLIQLSLEENDLFRYVVVCSDAPFVYAVRMDTAYCSSNNEYHTCHAFAI